jgi:hypothetical protein
MATPARLTDQNLLNTIAGFPPDVRQDPTSRTFYLCLAIVIYFLGREWADEHVQDTGQATGGYVRLDWKDRAQEQAYRIVDLAELLFNLQHTVGFDDCIRRMHEGDIEGTYAELDLGRMLYQSEIGFRFVTRSGQKGDDFDIEIIFGDETICADAKCKLEATAFSERTVINSLQHARTQFPVDRPSIVFVKVPPRWLEENSNIKVLLTKIANDFLRGTGRVVSVKYYISYIHWEHGFVTHIQAFQEINNTNPNNRFDPSRNWDMFIEADDRTVPNESGDFSDVPRKWRRLLNFPHGIARDK